MELDELSEEQRKILHQLRNNVKDLLNPTHDDYYLTRWLKARKFNINKAEKMLREHFQIRKMHGLDTILEDFQLPKVIKNYTPFSVTGFDKDGDIILVLLSGLVDMKGSTYAVMLEEFTKCIFYIVEDVLHQLEEENKKTGRNARRLVAIVDMKGLKVLDMLDRTVGKWQLCIFQTFANNYPEILKSIVVINTPRIYYLWFNIAKAILDIEILKKMKFFEADGWKEHLLEVMEANTLPAFLGGTLTDPDGNPECITMFAQGRKIPSSYYMCNKDISLMKDKDVKVVNIRERSYFDHTLNVTDLCSVITWSFCTESNDIGFAIYYAPHGVNAIREVNMRRSFRHNVRRSFKNDHEILIPLEKLDSHLRPEEGEISCEKAGTYILHFDNTYSWMTPKTLYYKVEVRQYVQPNRPNSDDCSTTSIAES